MFSNAFSFVDNTLIDKYFQPACDYIRNKFGWTKSLPTGVALIIAIVGRAPLTTAVFIAGYSVSWILFLLAGIMLCWILVHTFLAAYLISAGFHSETWDSTKLTGEKGRKWVMMLSIIVLPIVLAALTFPADEGVGTIVFAYLIAGIANICSECFSACTDSSECYFCRRRDVQKTHLR